MKEKLIETIASLLFLCRGSGTPFHLVPGFVDKTIQILKMDIRDDALLL